MKKTLAIFIAFLISASFFGCMVTDGENNGPGMGEDAPNIQEYFPIKQNVRYVFEGTGNEYASYVVSVDYTSENKVQQRIDNGGTVTARVLALSDGKLQRTLLRGEAYYRENLLSKTDASQEVLLMEPLSEGTSWTLFDGRVRTITNLSADVTTPSGSYKALTVTTESPNGKTVDYYVKNIGFVKSVFSFEGNEVTSSLSKIDENFSHVQRVSFFYPNINDEKIYYSDRDVIFKTNDVTGDVLTEAYREVISQDLGKVVTTNTKILSLTLDDQNVVHIDFNNAFLTEMNAGASYEAMILQCIADTFGKYYNSSKVALSVEKKPYESGHIILNDGEFIEPKPDQAVEIK